MSIEIAFHQTDTLIAHGMHQKRKKYLEDAKITIPYNDFYADKSSLFS